MTLGSDIASIGAAASFLIGIYYLIKTIFVSASSAAESIRNVGEVGGALADVGEAAAKKGWNWGKAGVRGVGKGAGYLGKGAKWAGKKVYGAYKNRAIETLKKEADNLKNLEEVKTFIETLIGKQKTIENKEFKDIINIIKNKISEIIKNEEKYKIDDIVKNIVLYYNEVAEELSWVINLFSKEGMQFKGGGYEIPSLKDKINRIQVISEDTKKLITSLISMGNKEAINRLADLLQTLEKNDFTAALKICDELIELKKVIINLESNILQNIENLEKLRSEIESICSKIEVITPKTDEEITAEARSLFFGYLKEYKNYYKLKRLKYPFIDETRNLPIFGGFVWFLKDKNFLIGDNLVSLENELIEKTKFNIDDLGKMFDNEMR